jgi:hypothetical protein
MLRAFRLSLLVAIDVDEAIENEDRTEEDGPVTVEEVKGYLEDAIRLDIDTEEYGNPVGFQSAEIEWGSMKELPEAEVKRLYKKG